LKEKAPNGREANSPKIAKRNSRAKDYIISLTRVVRRRPHGKRELTLTEKGKIKMGTETSAEGRIKKKEGSASLRQKGSK